MQSFFNSVSVPVRRMAGAATIPTYPSGYQYYRFKDHIHYYFFIGLAPVFLVSVGAYLFIGPAELVDTPEGYEPKHWEYYSNPIKRFFARYVYENPAVLYERQLDVYHRQAQNQLDFLFREKVKKTMARRQDFQGYYFYTYDVDKIEKHKKAKEKQEPVHP